MFNSHSVAFDYFPEMSKKNKVLCDEAHYLLFTSLQFKFIQYKLHIH